MNVREYFEAHFFAGALEDSLVEARRNLIFNKDGGAGDGCTVGDILAEMPLDSNCGDDCRAAVDATVSFIAATIAPAHGSHYGEANITRVIEIAADCCLTFIRG